MNVRNRLLGGLMAAMSSRRRRLSTPAAGRARDDGPGARNMGGGQGYGYGPSMTGPGMMGGYGMGPGMMGDYGMGPGMMGGYGLLSALDLTDDQRKKMQAIYDELRKKNWETLGKMREEGLKLRDLGGTEKRDKPAISPLTSGCGVPPAAVPGADDGQEQIERSLPRSSASSSAAGARGGWRGR